MRKLLLLLLFIPTLAFGASDDFNRVNADPLDGNWTAVSADTNRLVGNAVQSSSCDTAYSRYTGSSFGNDQEAQVSLPSASSVTGWDFAGIMVRETGNQGASHTAYLGIIAPAQGYAEIDLLDSDADPQIATMVGSFAFTINDNDVFKLRAIGPDIRLYQNGTQILNVIDSAVTSGRPGLITFCTVSVDSFVANDLTAVPPSAVGAARIIFVE